MALTRLGDIDYSHLKVDSDLKNDKVNDALLQDLQTAGEKAGVVITITTAKSDHDVHTKSGNISRHSLETAVDIAKLDGKGSAGATNSTNGNEEFREKGNRIKDVLVSMGYTWNREKGNDKAVLWQTNTGGNHYNHLHVSNKTGQSSEVDPNFEPKSDTSSSDDGGFFGKMSDKEKEDFQISLLGMFGASESKEKIDDVIKETIRIKDLMK